MHFVVISRPGANDRREELRPAEEEALQEMIADGMLVQIYRRCDGAGAYSIIEADSPEAARERLERLPFVRERAITIDIIPVIPRYTGAGARVP